MGLEVSDWVTNPNWVRKMTRVIILVLRANDNIGLQPRPRLRAKLVFLAELQPLLLQALAGERRECACECRVLGAQHL